ncbi:universal stress protein [Antrihabitans stalactiti]|uniref:Universal stress protein n=1 Tax=Antrihabitans stalactiti TaxID=2584121 RepID=A0A848K931_9NOCA|nr:universal stress protein [Antrihabitans stalactiti]NMN93938.1 universal stress protein [Antrihabitans stalactiti]
MSESVPRGSIVVGVDGSRTSYRAAQWAAELAGLRRVPLVIARAVPSTTYFSDADAQPIEEAFRLQALTAAKDEVAGSATSLRREHPGLVVSWHVYPGTGADILVDLSKSASLIVVGATGRSRTRTSLLGSTATQVANHAACPVAVWRGEHASATPDARSVVVGVDGSPTSERAIEYAFDFASTHGAPLVAVHTWIENELPYPPTVAPAGDEERETALLAECLAGWSEKFPDVEVVRVCKQASPGVELLTQAQDAQLVVVGSHGRHNLAGALLGSTSQRLVHRSPCPVVVCRGDAQR